MLGSKRKATDEDEEHSLKKRAADDTEHESEDGVRPEGEARQSTGTDEDMESLDGLDGSKQALDSQRAEFRSNPGYSRMNEASEKHEHSPFPSSSCMLGREETAHAGGESEKGAVDKGGNGRADEYGEECTASDGEDNQDVVMGGAMGAEELEAEGEDDAFKVDSESGEGGKDENGGSSNGSAHSGEGEWGDDAVDSENDDEDSEGANEEKCIGGMKGVEGVGDLEGGDGEEDQASAPSKGAGDACEGVDDSEVEVAADNSSSRARRFEPSHSSTFSAGGKGAEAAEASAVEKLEDMEADGSGGEEPVASDEWGWEGEGKSPPPEDVKEDSPRIRSSAFASTEKGELADEDGSAERESGGRERGEENEDGKSLLELADGRPEPTERVSAEEPTPAAPASEGGGGGSRDQADSEMEIVEDTSHASRAAMSSLSSTALREASDKTTGSGRGGWSDKKQAVCAAKLTTMLLLACRERNEQFRARERLRMQRMKIQQQALCTPQMPRFSPDAISRTPSSVSASWLSQLC